MPKRTRSHQETLAEDLQDPEFRAQYEKAVAEDSAFGPCPTHQLWHDLAGPCDYCLFYGALSVAKHEEQSADSEKPPNRKAVQREK